MAKNIKPDDPTYPVTAATQSAFDRALPGLVSGYTRNADQIEYALRVAGSFGAPSPSRSEGGEITLLEAGTGIGKSLGYLIPLLINSTLTGEKAMVSTHTLALQQQLTEVDGPLACDAVEQITGKRPTIARRVGRRNFIDYDRARDLIRDAAANGREDIVTGLRAFLDTAPGSFDEAVQVHGLSLPDGVSRDDICVNAGSSLAASRAYLDHVQASQQADVIVLNHALSMIDAKIWGRAIVDHGSGQRRLAVFDEADTLPSVARDMADQRLPVRTLKMLAKGMSKSPERGIPKTAISTLGQHLDALVKDGDVLIDAGQHLDLLALVEDAKIATKDAARTVAGQDEDLSEDLGSASADLDEWLDAARSRGYLVPMVSPSPTSSRPALRLISTDPGRMLSRLWSRPRSRREPFLRSVVFTSATLSSDGEGNFSGFTRAMGVNPAWSNYSSRSASFEPNPFGSVEFRLADRSVPAPFLKDTGDHNPAWLDYAAEGIRAAHQAGGRTLVLCQSYADAQVLGQRVAGALVHRKGQPLAPLLEAYKATPDAVLLTPAAWAGVNLPGLVQQLVIPRVPFAPADTARNMAREQAMVARGVDPKTAARVLQGEAMADARRKLRQGIGRGIRRASDSCTVWLLDPRFPLPQGLLRVRRLRLTQGLASKHGALTKVIPRRFLDGRNSAYERATIFPVAGEGRPNKVA